jgi:hypothetical protein
MSEEASSAQSLLRGALFTACVLLVCVACASQSNAGPEADDASSPGSSTAKSPNGSTYPSSIVVIGHSGTTGAGSDPKSPGADAVENSWATGTNPAVDSVYLQVLAKNQSVKGHNANFGVDGSDVVSLLDQAGQAADVKPTPELVLVQSIDNDMLCDGTDPQNFGPYEQKLTGVLDALTRDLPKAKIFFVDQWANAASYDKVALQIKPGPPPGTGPCDVVNAATGKFDKRREVYVQALVDHYFAIITNVCGKYPSCQTDRGAMQDLRLDKADLTADLNHLSVSGQMKMAAIAFSALYG